MTEDARYAAALAYATEKHKGQFRKGGLPYIIHPIAVAEKLRSQGYDTDTQIAGLFHDLLEDTDATPQEIEALGGPAVADAVQRLTKVDGYVMKEYIAGIRENPMALAVKTADRLHNLRSAVCTTPAFRSRYILESLEWFLDFSPEICRAALDLADTLENPVRVLTEDLPHSSAPALAESFVLRGDILFSDTPDTFSSFPNSFLVCENGTCAGVYASLPDKYNSLPVLDYTGHLIFPGLVCLNYAVSALPLLKGSAVTHAVAADRFASDLPNAEDLGAILMLGKIFEDAAEQDAAHAVCSSFFWIRQTISGGKALPLPVLTKNSSPEMVARLQAVRKILKLPLLLPLPDGTDTKLFPRLHCLTPRALRLPFDAKTTGKVAVQIQYRDGVFLLSDEEEDSLSFPQAFWRATREAGQLFGGVGAFDPGMEFHAIVLDDRVLPVSDTRDLPHRLKAACAAGLLSGSGSVAAKFVSGRAVFGGK